MPSPKNIFNSLLRSSTPLIETIKKSFELYHVCHKPPKATLTDACLLHNDYMYIAHYIQIIGCRFSIKQEGSGFVLLDLLAFFRREGERCLNVELVIDETPPLFIFFF